ncbi:MAG: MotA/TolQ/ExbB proton channel family protein [Planctomycetota bacterium]
MITTETILEQGKAIWDQACALWVAGGWAMVAIAVIALVMFAMGMHVHLNLRRNGFQSVPEKTWRRWIDSPAERKGPIGALLDYVTRADSLKATRRCFNEVHTMQAASFDRDLHVMKIAVNAAPLVGLLGTVTGMLATFGALASGSGGDKTMGLVAKGISEALITTETGLVIALPGLFFQYQLTRRYQRYKAFLAKLESICTQTLYPLLCGQEKLHLQSSRPADLKTRFPEEQKGAGRLSAS